MLIRHNSDEYTTKVDHRICAFHKRNPLKSYAGCTCSSSYSLVKKEAQ